MRPKKYNSTTTIRIDTETKELLKKLKKYKKTYMCDIIKEMTEKELKKELSMIKI